MKKIIGGLLFALFATAAVAQNSVSYDVGAVRDYKTGVKSDVQYLRGNIAVNEQYSVGLLSRTQRYTADNFVINQFELTAKRAIGNGYVGIGAGRDAGVELTYAIATAGYFLQTTESGAGVFVGVQHNYNKPRRDHSLAWVGYSIPVAKNVTINPAFTRNYGDFKEDEFTIGFAITF